MQQIVIPPQIYPRVEVAGEDALIIYLGEVANEHLSQKISQLKILLSQEISDCLVELIPSYISLLVIFNPLVNDYYGVKHVIEKYINQSFNDLSSTKKTIDIPVYYAQQSGPDLKVIAEKAGISIAEVIRIHQEKTYQVYAIGFAPGFAFLGEVDKRIATPRLTTPRKKVPKGAVGIADQQTAIYPESSPGGWNLIGLCPLTLFNSKTQPHTLYEVGDSVKFNAISKTEFLALGGVL